MVHGWGILSLSTCLMSFTIIISFVIHYPKYLAYLSMACTGVGAITFTIHLLLSLTTFHASYFLLRTLPSKHLYVGHVQYHPAPSVLLLFSTLLVLGTSIIPLSISLLL